MTNMSLVKGNDRDSSCSSDIEEDIKEEVLVLSNPVFQEAEPSSKIKTVVAEVIKLKTLHDQDKTEPFQKAIIVSQWTSMLNIIKMHVKKLGLKIAEINGKTQQTILSCKMINFCFVNLAL